ncbi:LysR substrate-binding domain-containing protein [Burkholderia gladioli]|uniref:LysR substrate-binding domain-containing protein n=1 Tax=Burkholderia gladioli TaxID=28095 RepID=UPI00164096AD|nr:LysR substrate-binding domain-containing protein [Burkholderia gladioli]
MGHTNLDMDVLRTVVIAHRLGSFNRAAEHIGRSQSAVSQQIHKLEEQVGAPLFVKQGRGLVLTEAGDVMLAYARRMLDLNDEMVATIRGRAVAGRVRFGLPPDFAEAWLPAALGRFKRAHPSVLIDVVVDANRRLLERLDNEELDLVLALGSNGRKDAEVVAALPFVWVGPAAPAPIWGPGEPIPVVAFEAPCFFRKRALDTLDQAGMAWRIALTSPSLHGLWAAIEAGLGVTVRTPLGLPERLRIWGDSSGLPPILSGPLQACLHTRHRTMEPALAQFKAVVLETMTDHLGDAVAA